MMATATTARNARLIVEMIITSHTYIVFCFELYAQGAPPHHSYSLLTSAECACVEHYPWAYCTRKDIWRALPSK